MRAVKIILVVLVGLGVAAALVWRFALADQVAFARVATNYGAKKVCSCLHVSGRGLSACEADFTEDVSAVTFTALTDGARADVLGGRITATARHVPGQGCRLVE